MRSFDLADRRKEDQAMFVREFLREDCRRGFQTDDAPLMRLALFSS